ncbi:Formate--tetrahydrofolate ligase [Labeo rohita]|uniref:Formate--tetrahydrofolate ligase n=1 Tax=Labeo rohita TaxID=84645 RepID=A0ABQ8LPB7_LABRO|nr:Formate--tetrahydrofolate ligase [Labeo rohita]
MFQWDERVLRTAPPTAPLRDIHVELPACSEQYACLDFPPTLPVLSPPVGPATSALPPLSPDSPAAHPQATICAVDSASALRPSGSTPALSSLISTDTCRATSSTGLHHPSGSTLVGRRPTIASGLHSFGCTSSLRPIGSVGLLPPSSSASALCHSGSLRNSTFASVARALGSALALRILGVALDLRLSVSASGSTSTCSATVGRPPRVVSSSSTMALPSVGSAVGYHCGCGLGPTLDTSVSSLAPPSVRPTLNPSVSSLAPPSVVTALDFVCCPPPGSPSSA